MRAIVLCLFLGLAPVAHALVITQSLTRTGQTAEYLSGSPLGKFGGTFQQFDPGLGQLQAVNLSFSGTVTYYVDYQSAPGYCVGGCYADVNFSTGYVFNAPGFPRASETWTDFFSIVSWGQQVFFNSETGSYQYSTYYDYGGPYTSYSPYLHSDSLAGGVFYSGSPDSLAGYLGAGSVMIDGAISEDSDVCSNNGIKPTCSDYLNLTTTLRYVYAPAVSEPPPEPIFALGLAGLIWLARRRRKRG
jgi:MYXO-CTERM domain-containing protein